jgi:mevalonate kinase
LKQTFYSNGKLLITGEYVVLDGAMAFALPTKFGQYMHVEELQGEVIKWVSYDHDGSVWFEGTISFLEVIQKMNFEHDSVKTTLVEILHDAYKMNPDFILKGKGYLVTTELTFPKKWGLGTSSTLINNIAQWLRIDAFELLTMSFGGSGYDIACAQNNSAITYQLLNDKPVVEKVPFLPIYKDKVFFIYLNKKQDSRNAITSYFGKNSHIDKSLPIINAITKRVIEAQDPKEFAMALQQHEIELSNVLELATVKETLFSDFNGVIKSLGAWGGDFVLSISKENPKEYFRQKGYEIVLSYEEMIL